MMDKKIYREISSKQLEISKAKIRLKEIRENLLINIEYEKAGDVPPFDYAELHREAQELRSSISEVPKTISSKAAVYARTLFPVWDGTKQYTVGDRVLYKGYLYMVEQDVTTPIENWTPDVTYAYYTPIAKAGETGEKNRPIEAVSGMRYIIGLYYLEGERLFLCKRTGSEDGEEHKLHYLPSALIGQYFEEVLLNA